MFDGTPRGALTAMMIRCCSTSRIWCTWKTFFLFLLLLLLLFVVVVVVVVFVLL